MLLHQHVALQQGGQPSLLGSASPAGHVSFYGVHYPPVMHFVTMQHADQETVSAHRPECGISLHIMCSTSTSITPNCCGVPRCFQKIRCRGLLCVAVISELDSLSPWCARQVCECG